MMLGQMQQPNDDSDRIKIACLLLDRKANIQTTNKSGKTPLQVCRSQRVKDAVETYNYNNTNIFKRDGKQMIGSYDNNVSMISTYDI
jgi:hypothetical protein